MHRMLIISSLAVGVFAMGWPASAGTKNNSSTRVHTQELTVKKTTDTATAACKVKKPIQSPKTMNDERGMATQNMK